MVRSLSLLFVFDFILLLVADIVTIGKIGTVGITEFASNKLGDVVYIELPETGVTVKQKDTLLALESVKVINTRITQVPRLISLFVGCFRYIYPGEWQGCGGQ